MEIDSKNIAYIDGQNLFMGTTKNKPSWGVDLARFKVYLQRKYGDYKMLVDFLIEEKRFKKILFPNRKYASSLYKSIGAQYFAYLDDTDTKKKIQKMKRAP
jgi:hypothetical protein